MAESKPCRNTPADVIAYLLGRLPVPGKEQFEQRYFEEDHLFKVLCDAEEELIGGYVRGELSGEMLRDFEARYMEWPMGRARVERARELLGPSVGAATCPPDH